MKAKRIFLLMIVLVAFTIPFISTKTVTETDKNYFEITKNIRIMSAVYDKLNAYYVDEPQPGELMKKAIDAMLQSLDPYTVYIPQSNIEDYRYMIYPQSTYGIGANNYENEQSVLDYQQWRLYQYVARRVKKQLYLGLGFLLDNYHNISEESFIEGETDYVKYMKNDFSDELAIGFAFQTIYDDNAFRGFQTKQIIGLGLNYGF